MKGNKTKPEEEVFAEIKSLISAVHAFLTVHAF
jgi:hypothetical protein